mgnify:CR=1 FL=1
MISFANGIYLEKPLSSGICLLKKKYINRGDSISGKNDKGMFIRTRKVKDA